MEANEGDWILYRAGPLMRVGVVRYVLRNEEYARGRFFYQTDEARVAACDVYEVRAKPANGG